MNLVRQFHLAFGSPAPEYPSLPREERLLLRMHLITEEYEEVIAELRALRRQVYSGAPVEESFATLGKLLKELADLRVVLEGTAVECGLDIDNAFAEVMRSNMSKLGTDGRPIFRDDGKILKGPNYSEADMGLFIHVVQEA